MERVMGIEPTLSAWEAEVLPLNYTRCYFIILSWSDDGLLSPNQSLCQRREERRGAFIEKTRDILFFVTKPKAEPHRFLTTDVPLEDD